LSRFLKGLVHETRREQLKAGLKDVLQGVTGRVIKQVRC
jgi:hypothetical protein